MWEGGRVWFMAAVLKTVGLRTRGFKSYPSRHTESCRSLVYRASLLRSASYGIEGSNPSLSAN